MKKVTLFFALLLSMVATTVKASVLEKVLSDTPTALEHNAGWETGLVGTVNNAWSLPIKSAVEKDLAQYDEGFYWGMGNNNTLCAASDLSSYTTTAFNMVGRQAYTGTYAAQIYTFADLGDEVVSTVSASFEAYGSRNNSSFSIWVIDAEGTATMVAASESKAIEEGSVCFSAENLTVGNTDKIILIWNANTAGQTINISNVSVTMSTAAGGVKTGIYRIKNVYKGRGELVYNENYANPQLNNITLGSYDVNNVAPTGNGTYWYVRNYNEKVYIYNVEANKFLQVSGDKAVYSATTNENTAFTTQVVEEDSVKYIVFAAPGETTFLSASPSWEPGENQVRFLEHEADADYMTLLTDSGETMAKYAEQVAAANNLIEGVVKITYIYTFDGDTVRSEDFIIAAGDARPESTCVPYACEADYSAVPDYVDETGVFVIPINTTENFPFQFSKDYASASWNTWRMANREGGTASFQGYVWNNGKKYQQTNLEEQPSAAKYLYAFIGTPFGFKIMTADERYLYTTKANNVDVVASNEGTTFAAVASEVDPAEAWTDYDKLFYFNAVGAGGGVNEMDQGDGYRKVGYWSGGGVNDKGSLVAIEPVDPSIIIYKIVFADKTPEQGGVTYDDETYVLNGPCNAIASDTELSADDLEGEEVEGYEVVVTLENNIFTVTYTPTRSEAWLELSALIDEATKMTLPEGPWGTDPGYYNQEAVEAFPDAIDDAYDVLENGETDEEYRQATADLRAAIKALQPYMPEVGKIYMWVNAKKNGEGQSIWQAQQGVDKVAYSTGTKLRWHTLDRGDLSNFWVVKAVNNDTIVFQNVMDGKYPKGFSTANQPIPMDTVVNGCRLIALGDAEFGIRSVGSTKSMHAGQYNDGNAIDGDMQIWDTPKDGYSAWYIKECNEFDITFWGEYNTLIVPFDAEIPGGLEVFTCATVSGNGTLDLESASTIEANTPYIVKGTPDETVTLPIANLDIVAQPVTEGLLTGVFVPDSIPVGGYFFINEEGYDCFMKRSEELSGEETPMVTGGHCFIRDLGCPAEFLYFDPALAIENLDANGQQPTANAIFNLAGQKMNKVQKGINIVDGKKVIY